MRQRDESKPAATVHAASRPAPGTGAELLQLQRSVGNRAVAASLAPAAQQARPGASPVARTIRRQPAKPTPTADQAEFAIWQLEAVLVYEDKSAIGDPRSPRQAALAQLFAAVTGRDLHRRKVGGRERRESLDDAVLGLRDVLAIAPESDRARLRGLREQLFRAEAYERIEQSVVVGG